MSDDIRTLSAELAADPASLVFLRLGEALRQAGRLEAAAKVLRQGLARYPELPEAHDLYARVLVDRGELEAAFDEWDMTLRLDPGNPAAQKGLGYLYYKAGDYASALRHLEAAAAARPDDANLAAVIARVKASEAERGTGLGAPAPAEEPVLESGVGLGGGGLEDDSPAPAGPASDQPAEPAGGALEEDGVLLVDASGLRLLGTLSQAGAPDAADQVAAELAGVSREAGRTVRLLGLGEWQSLAVEATQAHLFLVPPTPDTLLLARRDPSIPMGRVALGAGRALTAARLWLEQAR